MSNSTGNATRKHTHWDRQNQVPSSNSLRRSWIYTWSTDHLAQHNAWIAGLKDRWPYRSSPHFRRLFDIARPTILHQGEKRCPRHTPPATKHVSTCNGRASETTRPEDDPVVLTVLLFGVEPYWEGSLCGGGGGEVSCRGRCVATQNATPGEVPSLRTTNDMSARGLDIFEQL